MFITWIILFHQFKEINGWGVGHMMLMEGIVVGAYSIYAFCFRGVAEVLAGQIERGELDTFILQPRNILLNLAGSRSHPAALGDVITGFVFLFWSGMTTFQTLPLILLSVIVGFLTFLSLGIFVGSLAFYMKDVEGWGQQIINIFIHVGNQPGSIYTGDVRLFLTFVFPVGLITFMPIEMITNPTFSGIFAFVGLIAMFFSASIWFFYRGLKRYESGNIFGVRG